MSHERKTDPRYKQLSHEEALRALYIDFEGGADQPPVLVGLARRPGRGPDPHVWQALVDPDFGRAGPDVMTLAGAIEHILARAERRDRRIVSWSEHDLRKVQSLSAEYPGLVERFEARYANAHKVAERWLGRLHPDDKIETGALADYMAYVGYRVPAEAGPGEVGETIRRMRRSIAGKRPFTADQQKRWRDLLDHNRHDCAGTRAVCLRATRELDADDEHRRASRGKRRPRGS